MDVNMTGFKEFGFMPEKNLAVYISLSSSYERK
jgi:hypothetical protein